jgi:hypothetical protein
MASAVTLVSAMEAKLVRPSISGFKTFNRAQNQGGLQI